MTLCQPVTRVSTADHPEEFTIYQDGATANITTAVLTLTINPSEDGSETDISALSGTLTDSANGVVEFAPDSTVINLSPGTYFYDVKMTLAGEITFPSRGKWVVLPNIT